MDHPRRLSVDGDGRVRVITKTRAQLFEAAAATLLLIAVHGALAIQLWYGL